MARPTEEELGIAPTPEELEVLSRPPAPMEPDDDIPRDDEDEEVAAAPKPEGEQPGRVKDPVTGKFVAKPKDGEPGKVETPPAADDRKVDLRALQEERALRRQTEERMQVLLETLQKREAREAKKDEPAAPARPTLDGDPLGLVGDHEDRLSRIENETKAERESRQAAERDEQEFQQVLSVATPQFNEAAATDATIMPTYSALLESFAKEICYINGIPANSAEMTQAQKNFVGAEMTKLEHSHIRHAVGKGLNVAEYMKNLAGVRGVVAPAAAAASTPVASTPAAQPAPKSIAERQAAQSRHLSIGDLPGSAAPATVSAKDLGKMSQKEFNAFMKTMSDAETDALFLKA